MEPTTSTVSESGLTIVEVRADNGDAGELKLTETFSGSFIVHVAKLLASATLKEAGEQAAAESVWR